MPDNARVPTGFIEKGETMHSCDHCMFCYYRNLRIAALAAAAGDGGARAPGGLGARPDTDLGPSFATAAPEFRQNAASPVGLNSKMDA